jgi:hypothetical protein
VIGPRLDDAPAPESGNGVKSSLTPKVENGDFAAFQRRVLKAAVRRVDGDIEALADLVALADEFEVAIRTVVADLRRDYGYSWTEIGRRLGVTRQGAQQRWGQR